MINEKIHDPLSGSKKLSDEEIREKVFGIFGNILRTKHFETNVNFTELGVDSIQLVMLVTMISEEFNVKLPVTFLFENQTVDLVVKYLVSEGTSNV